MIDLGLCKSGGVLGWGHPWVAQLAQQPPWVLHTLLLPGQDWAWARGEIVVVLIMLPWARLDISISLIIIAEGVVWDKVVDGDNFRGLLRGNRVVGLDRFKVISGHGQGVIKMGGVYHVGDNGAMATW